MMTTDHSKPMKFFIAYLRLSKKRKAKDGQEEPDYYGLDAQRTTISDSVAKESGTTLSEYIEIESGRRKGLRRRTEIKKAITHCKETGATLIVAKLDRLARDVEFTTSVINSGVDVLFCDFPYAGKLVITIIAAVAEYEGERISQRTKEGLAIAKSRGVKLGNPNISSIAHAGAAASAIARKAYHHETPNMKIKTRIDLMLRDNIPPHQIATTLNSEGCRSTMNKPFNERIIKRIISH